ncbi:MAG: tRNA pseudouridine(55) synthase TruB [Dehalococcoidia bacterium]|jgi:tRNA pseudouridine55 synthase
MSTKKNTAATISGILNINKPPDRTSQDVVSFVKRLSKQRRVGHAGTLDPLATGVLPICLGQATRMSSFFMELRKTYVAEITLGISTNTYDREGTVTQQKDPSYVTKEQIDGLLPALTGTIMQKPPAFSALKRQGKRLYELARMGIDVEPDAREVSIYRIEVLDWNTPLLTVEVECGRGTYIRSIAKDIGDDLGCGGHISRLIRTRYGPFDIKDSIGLPQLEDYFDNGCWRELLHPLDVAIADWPALTVDGEQELAINNGRDIPSLGDNAENRCRAYSSDGRFLAIMRYLPDKESWHPEKVFQHE